METKPRDNNVNIDGKLAQTDSHWKKRVGFFNVTSGFISRCGLKEERRGGIAVVQALFVFVGSKACYRKSCDCCQGA